MEQREFIVEQETAGQRIDRFLSGAASLSDGCYYTGRSAICQ